jgi:hypothetical protein
VSEQLQFRSLVIVEVFEVDAMADAIGNNAVPFFFFKRESARCEVDGRV